jgi:hypothetical protein
VIAERRIQEEEAERQSMESSLRRHQSHRSSLHVPAGPSEGRRSTDSQGGHSLSSISRNRFFRHRSGSTRQDDLMEQGRSEQGSSSAGPIHPVSSSSHPEEKKL